jgi:hypothetical protein
MGKLEEAVGKGMGGRRRAGWLKRQLIASLVSKGSSPLNVLPLRRGSVGRMEGAHGAAQGGRRRRLAMVRRA